MEIPGYTILRKINSGGMATVYLATQLSVGRTVALKIMKPELDQDPEFHQRFEREAVIIGQLSHPNIIPIYDIGRFNGLNFISMEYLPNGSLDEKITKGINPQNTLGIIIAIASALEHAHQRGYVHRDIKPENILFRADNSAVLTDFGIARTIKTNSSMTQVGSVIGTPYYMSPEQAKGHAIDGRADLYSLGILIYEMLTGSRPFQQEDSLALAIQHLEEAPPKLPIQFFNYQPILDKLLAKKPADRFQNANELLMELEAIKHASNPLLQHPRGKTNSLHLLNAILHTIINDGRIFALKIAVAFHKIRKTDSAVSDLTLFDPALSPERAQANTTISSAAVNFPTATSNTKKIVTITVVFIVLMSAFIWRNSLFGQHLFTSHSNGQETFSLTIRANPNNANIRILNIPEKYFEGIALTPGAYHIEVTAPSHQTLTEWITVKKENQKIPVTLTNNLDIQKHDAGINLIPCMIEIPTGGFYMSRYEITFNEYDDFAIATHRELPDDNGWGRGNHPVINVSWNDAQAYATWLTQKTGKRYRLPTDSEWEIAARANTNTQFWWGDDEQIANEYANCGAGCKSFLRKLFNSKTYPVGHFSPNEFGLYDVSGNAAEWVDSCEKENKADANNESNNIVCDIRGGSFRSNVGEVSIQANLHLSADNFNDHTGFRLLREMDDQKHDDRESVTEQGRNILQRLINKLR